MKPDFKYPPDSPDEVRAAAHRYERLVQDTEDVARGFKRARAAVAENSSGQMTNAACARADLLRSRVQNGQYQLEHCVRALREYADLLEDAPPKIRRIREEYEDAVRKHERERKIGSLMANTEGEAVAYSSTLSRLTTRYDELYTNVMDKAGSVRAILLDQAPQIPLSADGRDKGQAQQLLAAPLTNQLRRLKGEGDPEKTNAWWKSLSPAEQAALLATQYGMLGMMDGIPASIRDQANRRVLNDDIRSLEQRLAHSSGEEKAMIEKRLGDAYAVSRALSMGKDTTLLLWDKNEGGNQALAAIGTGSIDNADHLAVHVGGMGSDFSENGPGRFRDIRALNKTAGKMRRGSVATIMYYGYEAPQNPVDVTNAALARRGSRSVNSLMASLNASHSFDPHMTLIGHSYGSSVAGIAAENTKFSADDLVVYGSPGVGDGPWQVGEDHRYVLRAEGDTIVPNATKLGNPLGVSPEGHFDRLSTNANEAAGTTESRGHSEYLKRGSTSQQNIAAVIAGAKEDLVR